MKRQHINKKYFVPTLISTSVLSSFVWAADAPATPVKKGMEEVVVTAQRRNEKLEDVPLSITAVSAESLERSGISSIEGIGRLSAGVQVNRAGSFTQPSIRGITTLTLGYGFENNVAVYVDGVYQADMISINTDLANISNVQILKGPQGTLYGRNATGGAIVIETLDPGKEAEGKVSASVGNLNDQRLQGYISAPLTDTLGFSIAAYKRSNDGYIRDIGTDPNSSADNFDAAPLRDRALRLKLKWTPSDALAITLGHNDTYHNDSRGLAYRITDYPASYLPAPPARATKTDEVSLNLISDAGVRVQDTTGKVVWDTGVGTLTSVTGYTERVSHSVFDFDGSKLQVTRAESTEIDQYDFQQSLDFYTNVIDRFDINVGATYFSDRFHNDNIKSYGFGGGLSKMQWIGLQTDAYAAYADVTWQPVDHLFLTAGYRYSMEDKSIAYREQSFTAAPAVPSVDKSKRFEDGTPRLILRYELSPSTNVYGSYSKGFRSGAFNPSPLPRPELVIPVKQEEVDAYEVGFKTVAGDLRFSTAAFYYDYTNLQVGATVPDPNNVLTNPPGTAVIQQVFNAPKAKIYGAEISAEYFVTNNLNVTANVSYTHARYTDFHNAFGTGLDAATGLNFGSSALPSTTPDYHRAPQPQDWTDQEMARAPLWSANAGFDYTLNNVIKGGDLTFAGNVAYTDSFVPANLSLWGNEAGAHPANQQRYRQGSYTTMNGQINWKDATGRYTVGVYGQNLTNIRYYLVRSGSSLGDYSQYAEPRTYGVKVGYSF